MKKKKPSLLLDEACFDSMQDERCIEILHLGAFDEEPELFKKMDEFMVEKSSSL